MKGRPSWAPHRGFSMIEVLITLIIVTFGLLGMANFVTRATAASVEASQRARASALLQDMAGRLSSNKPAAAADAYNTDAALGETALTNCALPTTAERDLCEWNNLLAGTNETAAGGAAPVLTFRGCITRPNAVDPVFVITVAWATNLPGIPPADSCAAGAFGSDESLRRTLRTVVRVATLTA